MPSGSQTNINNNVSTNVPIYTNTDTGDNREGTNGFVSSNSNTGITDSAWQQIFVEDNFSSKIQPKELDDNKDSISQKLSEDFYKTNNTIYWKPYEFRGSVDSLATVYYDFDDYPTDNLLVAVLETAEYDSNLKKEIDKKRGTTPANLNLIDNLPDKVNDMYNYLNCNNNALIGIIEHFLNTVQKNNGTVFDKNVFNTMVYEIMNCSSFESRIESLAPYAPDGTPIYSYYFASKVKKFIHAMSVVQGLAEFIENYHNLQLKIAKGCMLKILAYMQKGQKHVTEVHSLRQQVIIAQKYADFAGQIYRDLNKNVANAQQLLSAHCYNALEPVLNTDGFKHIIGGLLKSMKSKKCKFTKTIEQHNVFYSRIYTLLEKYNNSNDEQKMVLMHKFIDYSVVHSYINNLVQSATEDSTQIAIKRLKEAIEEQAAPINNEFSKYSTVATSSERFQFNIYDSKKILKLIDVVDFKSFVEKIISDTVSNIAETTDKKIERLKTFKEEQYDQIYNMYSKVINKLPGGQNSELYYTNITSERDKLLKDYVLGASIDEYKEAIHKLKSQEQGLMHRIKTLNKLINNTEPKIVNMYNSNAQTNNTQEKQKISLYSKQIQEQIQLKLELEENNKAVELIKAQISVLENYPQQSLRNLIKENNFESEQNLHLELQNNSLIKLITKGSNNKENIIKYNENGEIIIYSDEKENRNFNNICSKYADFYTGCTLEEFDNLNTIIDANGVRDQNHVALKAEQYVANVLTQKEKELDNIISEFISMSVIEAEQETNIKPLVKARNTCVNILDKTTNILNNITSEFKTLETKTQDFNATLEPIKTVLANNYTAALNAYNNGVNNPVNLNSCLELKNNSIDLKNNIATIQNILNTCTTEINKCLLEIIEHKKNTNNIGTTTGLNIEILNPLKTSLNSVNTVLSDIKNKTNALLNNTNINRQDLETIKTNFNSFINVVGTVCNQCIQKVTNNITQISGDITNITSDTDVNINTINQNSLIQELKPHFLSRNKTNNAKLEDFKPYKLFSPQNEQIEKIDELKQLFLMWIMLTRRNNQNFPSVVVIAKNNSIANTEEQQAIERMYNRNKGSKIKVKNTLYGNKILMQPQNIDQIIDGIVKKSSVQNIELENAKQKVEQLKQKLQQQNIQTQNNEKSKQKIQTPFITINTGQPLQT